MSVHHGTRSAKSFLDGATAARTRQTSRIGDDYFRSTDVGVQRDQGKRDDQAQERCDADQQSRNGFTFFGMSAHHQHREGVHGCVYKEFERKRKNKMGSSVTNANAALSKRVQARRCQSAALDHETTNTCDPDALVGKTARDRGRENTIIIKSHFTIGFHQREARMSSIGSEASGSEGPTWASDMASSLAVQRLLLGYRAGTGIGTQP